MIKPPLKHYHHQLVVYIPIMNSGNPQSAELYTHPLESSTNGRSQPLMSAGLRCCEAAENLERPLLQRLVNSNGFEVAA